MYGKARNCHNRRQQLIGKTSPLIKTIESHEMDYSDSITPPFIPLSCEASKGREAMMTLLISNRAAERKNWDDGHKFVF